MTFAATGLPSGLTLDETTGIITGQIDEAGTFRVGLSATNTYGTASAELTLIIGEELALTPPMGWNSWNVFGANIDEETIKGIADAMVASGMKDVGYQYVCIDDFWHGGRDQDGNLYPDPVKFPNGIKAVGEYVHAKGLKLGIYSDAGTNTCGGMPGSFGYEEQDAQTFASWAVDYLKYDYCYAPEDQSTAIQRYTHMGQALRSTGRSIVFSICEWGVRQPWLWAASAGGNLWRTTGDVRDTWLSTDGWSLGILNILDLQVGLEQYARRGHWNDPDMLVIGLYGRGAVTPPDGHPPGNDTEYRSQMTLWCLLAAPLLAGNDLRTMNATTRETLTNPEVIAVNQDALGRQARRVVREPDYEVWVKELEDDAKALGILNRRAITMQVTVTWSELEISGRFRVRDLWRKRDLGEHEDSIRVSVAGHETTLLRLTPV